MVWYKNLIYVQPIFATGEDLHGQSNCHGIVPYTYVNAQYIKILPKWHCCSFRPPMQVTVNRILSTWHLFICLLSFFVSIVCGWGNCQLRHNCQEQSCGFWRVSWRIFDSPSRRTIPCEYIMYIFIHRIHGNVSCIPNFCISLLNGDSVAGMVE